MEALAMFRINLRSFLHFGTPGGRRHAGRRPAPARARQSARLNVEVLETRVAPAVLVVNPHTATYTDVDGDQVTIKVSSGDLHTATFASVAGGLGEQLRLIDLHNGGFDNANLTVSVVKARGGDGLANIGYINSTGHDLGNVMVPGDLGQIDAGEATWTTT